MPEEQMPKMDQILNQFVDRHLILSTEMVKRDYIGIYWTSVVNIEIHAGFITFIEQNPESETIGLLLNMLDRAFEHVEGALVAYVTGSPASAEVVARCAVESALNVMYILAGDKVNRLNAYFRSYITESNRKIDQWLRETAKLTGEDEKIMRESAISRREAMKGIEQFVDWLGPPEKDAKAASWPKNVADKFDAVGEGIAYRTVYARMCSQTHNDAEDTLNYAMAVMSGDQDLLEKVGLETINFSRLFVYFGVAYYLKASKAFAKCFGFERALKLINIGTNVVDHQMLMISEEVGAASFEAEPERAREEHS